MNTYPGTDLLHPSESHKHSSVSRALQNSKALLDKIPYAAKDSYLKIIGRGNYNGYKDFMNDYFKHRDLIALKDMNRTDRIKYSRKLYKNNTASQ